MWWRICKLGAASVSRGRLHLLSFCTRLCRRAWWGLREDTPQARGDSTCPDWRTEEATGVYPQKARKMTGNCPKGDQGRRLQSVSAKVLRYKRAAVFWK